jgi:tagaturonate reductase
MIMLPSLNRALLDSGNLKAAHAPVPSGPINVLQIGEGNFLRAFVDWMIDIANGAGLINGAVTIAQPLPKGIADLLNAQDGLYTVLLRGVQNGKPVDSRRVVSCVKSALNPYAQWDPMLALAGDPALRFVISNTTEAGIVYGVEPFVEGQCPTGFPAKVAALLLARYQALGGRAAPGLVFLPCELIEANGSKLAACVLQHAKAWQLPAEFAAWVEATNVFCNTLVDRIVPGFPAGEADAIYAQLGYTDPLLVAAEPFHLWVIESPPGIADEFPLHKAGLDVVWTSDLAPYRTRKVRILNGAHTASSLAAFRAGLDTVKAMTEDPVVSRFLAKVMFDEIVPFVPLPDAERRAYAETIMERFANPHIRHELISIALNSVSKWQVRVLPTIKDYAAARGKAPPCLAFSLAALLDFYDGKSSPNGDCVGDRQGQPYPIRDNADALAFIGAAWRDSKDPSAVAATLLADARLWGEDLTRIADLETQVAASLARIKAVGVKTAMAGLSG